MDLIQITVLVFLAVGTVTVLAILLKMSQGENESKLEPARNDNAADAGGEKIAASGYRNIVKTARKQAKNLLYDTTLAASSILTDTKQTNERLEEQLDKVLQDIAKS